MKMLSRSQRYRETHNAVLDAEDELTIMQLLGHEISKYEIALIAEQKTSDAKEQARALPLVEKSGHTQKRKKGLFSHFLGRKK